VLSVTQKRREMGAKFGGTSAQLNAYSAEERAPGSLEELELEFKQELEYGVQQTFIEP
jgi:hypothetical protein